MVEYRAICNPDRCPAHPGELLREVVIPATGRTKTEIASLRGISRQHLYDITEDRKPVSPAVAVRLGKLFGNGAGVWVRMQGGLRHLARRAQSRHERDPDDHPARPSPARTA